MGVETNRVNSKSVIALTLGILSIIIPFVGLAIGIAGLFYANRSTEEIEQTGENGRGLVIAGKVCSIIGIVINGSLILGFSLFFTARTSYGV